MADPSLDVAPHPCCSSSLASFSSSSHRDISEHLFLLTRHPGHLFLSRPNHKVYMMAFVCVDQTCPLTNAAKPDKRSSPGIPGTVQEPNVLGTEAVDSHLVRPSLEGGVSRAGVHSVRGGCIAAVLCRLCHLGRCSCAGS